MDSMRGRSRRLDPVRFSVEEARGMLRLGREVDVRELARRAGFLLRDGGTVSAAQVDAMSAQLDLMMAEEYRIENSGIANSGAGLVGGRRGQRVSVAARLARVAELVAEGDESRRECG